jgi:peptidyl-prolyl cis-trans isomerase SurA
MRHTIFFALGLVVSLTVSARAEVINRIVAVVEDDAIFETDVRQVIKQYLILRGGGELSADDERNLAKQALDELINSRLIVAKAAKLGIEVSFAEVEERVTATIDDAKQRVGGEAAFQAGLEAEEMTLEQLKQSYREQLRNQMLMERLRSIEIDRSQLQMSEADLRAAYDERQDELPLRPAMIRLRTVFVGLSSSAAAQGEAKVRIDQLHQRIVSGEDFSDVAREFSEDPNVEQTGGSLGSLKLADLNEVAFAEAAASLAIGDVSEPVLTSLGYHLIKLTGRDDAAGLVELSHILIRITPGDDDVEVVFQRANGIHALLLAGAPFDSIAAVHSDEPSTAENGGDTGWLVLSDLPEFFRDMLATMRDGEVSQVIKEPAGFRIVQITTREDARPVQYSEIKDRLRNALMQEKWAGLLETYVWGLRDEFYVDIR